MLDKFCFHNPAALVCMFEMFLCPTKECRVFEREQWFLQDSVHLGLKRERGALRMGHDWNEQPADWDQLDNGAHYDLSRVAWRGEPWVCVQNSVVEIEFLWWNWIDVEMWFEIEKIKILIYVCLLCFLTAKYSGHSFWLFPVQMYLYPCIVRSRKENMLPIWFKLLTTTF